MRVAFVSTFPPLRCGIGTYTEMLAEALAGKGAEVVVLTERSVGEVNRRDLRVIPCFDSKRGFVEPVLREVEEAQPDVVHIQHDYTRYSPPERFLELLDGLSDRRVFVTMHAVLTRETSDYHPYCEELNRGIGERANIIVHQETARRVLLRIGVPPRRVRVIPHGTLHLSHRPDKRGCFNLPEERPVLAQFGFLKEQKQVHISIRAMPLILERCPKAFLFIGGSVHPYYEKDRRYHDYVDRCLGLIEELGLSDNVFLLNDFLSKERLERSICSADVLLFPEKMNYWSVSGMLHLALGARKPVVAARSPKFEEISRYISDELLFTPGDYKQLAKIAVRLLRDPQFSRAIRKRISRFASRTSWDRVAEMHLRAYSRPR